MAPFASSLVAFFLLTPLLVSAAPSYEYPRHIAGLPRDATHLALDEEAREIVAFSRSGENLGRFPIGLESGASRRGAVTGACADMSSDDVQKLPGWNTLKAAAEKNWGTGSYNVVTNDKDYVDQPAQSCASTDSVKIVPDGTPDASKVCTTQASNSDGKQVGTNGTIALAHSEGTSSSTTSTVTKQSAIAIGVSVAAEIDFPEIAKVTSTFSFTGTFTNTLSTASESKTDQTSTATVTQTNVAGKTCHLEFTTQSCTVTGSGKVRMLGTGWVWFEYNDKTQGHYKWALNIDSTLTNQDDRSTFIEFKTTTGSTSTSNYQGVCT
ncbi:hypothetical protein B0H10DRAFT_2428028 [Mycena sp. CBHHK59/15]|nr:hypothetical protein B0H10DRAFT_2428028 [Mycena sp. CBHHK59/15]